MSKTPRSTQDYPAMSDADIAKAIAEHVGAEAERARERTLRAAVQTDLENFLARSQALKTVGVGGFVVVFFGRDR